MTSNDWKMHLKVVLLTSVIRLLDFCVVVTGVVVGLADGVVGVPDGVPSWYNELFGDGNEDSSQDTVQHLSRQDKIVSDLFAIRKKFLTVPVSPLF